MERIEIKSTNNLTLVARHYKADSDTIIIMSHGFCADKSQSGRFDTIADAFQKSNYNVIAYDFAGCGESDDAHLSAEQMEEDLRSIIEYVSSLKFRKIILYGHSLGSLISLKCYSGKIKTMILTGAFTGPMDYNWVEYFSPEQMKEMDEKGWLTVNDESQWREKITVGQQILIDAEEVDQKELLQDVNCPVLIIHGNAEEDDEEKLLLQNSQRGLQYLSADSKIEIIDGADHRFYDHLNQIINLSTEWLNQVL